MITSRTASRQFIMISLFFVCLVSGQLALADTLVQGYKSDGTLAPGWIVRLNSNSTVSVAPSNDTSKIFGVVVDPSSSPVALSQNAPNQVFVATSGDYSALVSSENGPILAGDYISMSSTNGIGAEATRGQTTILGRAATAFDGRDGAITSTSSYGIGRVLVHVSVGPNPGYNQQSVNKRLKNLAVLVTGRNVSPARLYVAMAIFAVTFLAAITVIWAGIKGGMTSIGRNPLSKYSVFRGMTQVSILGIVILLVGLAAVYITIKV